MLANTMHTFSAEEIQHEFDSGKRKASLSSFLFSSGLIADFRFIGGTEHEQNKTVLYTGFFYGSVLIFM